MNQHPHYELFEELGRGENTVVYRAYDIALGREVAIKELDESGRRDPRHRERFLREAQFLAQFEHDNVLRVHTVDNDRGWIIMELMKGTLESVINDGSSTPDLVRSVMKQTLEALAFLHEKNKVHGAVRPSNLLINESGRVVLSEFEQTDAGGEIRVPSGSKKYLAPELIRPDFGDFGPPLDLYCLGFVALEMLKGSKFEGLFPGTGKGAIDADTAWLRWHSSPGDLESTRKLVKGIPDDLATVLDQMLKKRVADRPQSAQEVLKQLADLPLVSVQVEGMIENEELAVGEPQRLGPGVVKVLSAPQITSLSPSVSVTAPPDAKSKPKSKSAAAGIRKSPKINKAWFNQQLSKPIILYPLCGLILLGALWLSIRLNSSSPDTKAKMVAVTFDVEPEANDVLITTNEKQLVADEDGTYGFLPGSYNVTWSKAGFLPVTRELTVSAEKNTFQVKLEPEVKYVDLVVEVIPLNAALRIDGETKPLDKGTYTHKTEEGQPLQVEASLEGFVSKSQSISAEQLAKLGNKVKLELEQEKPRLPKSLVAMPGAALDRELQLPTRVLATGLPGEASMEFALVPPGLYAFGYSSETRQTKELAARKVRVDEPFYIAIHETTNAQYEKFFASVGEEQAGSRWRKASEKWSKRLSLDSVKNNLPVTNISPEQADAFCKWLGGRLPTEIEWESAVRGAQDRGFPFPWGSVEFGPDRCQIFNGNLGPVPVEQLTAGANEWGLMNALGNAAEWCQNSEQPAGFVLRGGSFATANINHVRVTWRGIGDPKGEEDTGFRVVVPVNSSNPPAIAKNPIPSDATAPNPLQIFSKLPWKMVSGAIGKGR